MASGSILEAWKRGWSRAETKVVIGDGAEWIWNLADQHFPGAVQIVDLYHARQHLWDMARKLHPNQEAEQRRWMMVHQDMLDGGKIEKLVVAIRSIDSTNAEVVETIRIESDYFREAYASACATPRSAASTCLSGPVLSKPAAKL